MIIGCYFIDITSHEQIVHLSIRNTIVPSVLAIYCTEAPISLITPTYQCRILHAFKIISPLSDLITLPSITTRSHNPASCHYGIEEDACHEKYHKLKHAICVEKAETGNLMGRLHQRVYIMIQVTISNSAGYFLNVSLGSLPWNKFIAFYIETFMHWQVVSRVFV